MVSLEQHIDLHDLKPKPKTLRRSVAIVSLHKAGTSYFGGKVLKQLETMVHIDHQQEHYNNGNSFFPNIYSRGYVYGILRLYDEDHPGKLITDSVIKKARDNNLNFILLMRDPRDLIVSMYYSFGFSHGLSPNEATKLYQLQRRKHIRSLSIDEYALDVLPEMKVKLSFLVELCNQIETMTLLKYDEMITNPELFFRKLCAAIPINNNFEAVMRAETRPRSSEDIFSHRRSGAVGGYKGKFQKSSIIRINHELRNELSYFEYL